MNNRQKGLQYVREVKKILEREGFIIDGPFYRPIFIHGKSSAVHSDLFGVFDLVAFFPANKMFSFHQVSLDERRAEKIKAILNMGMFGFFWGRGIENRRVYYKKYIIEPELDYEIIIQTANFYFIKGD